MRQYIVSDDTHRLCRVYASLHRQTRERGVMCPDRLVEEGADRARLRFMGESGLDQQLVRMFRYILAKPGVHE